MTRALYAQNLDMRANDNGVEVVNVQQLFLGAAARFVVSLQRVNHHAMLLQQRFVFELFAPDLDFKSHAAVC